MHLLLPVRFIFHLDMVVRLAVAEPYRPKHRSSDSLHHDTLMCLLLCVAAAQKKLLAIILRAFILANAVALEQDVMLTILNV